MTRRAVFLDRDGVINRAIIRARKPHPPSSLEELELLDGVPEALHALKVRGYCLVVVTNQPDVARGVTPLAVVNAINDRLRAILPIDAIMTCLHDDEDKCACRKPQPGLLTQAVRDLLLDIRTSYMVGDRWSDVEAGRRAGCSTFFVDNGYDEPPPQSCDYRVHSLLDAATIILQADGSS